MALAEEAEADGDDALVMRAVEKYYTLLAQADYLTRRPPDALCPRCRFGEEGWQIDVIVAASGLWECVAHIDVSAIVAARMADLRGEDAGRPAYVEE